MIMQHVGNPAIEARKVAAAKSFKEMVVKNRKYRVTWEYIGEGDCGDYTGDSADTPLLRFSVDSKEEGVWVGVDDGSYCTAMPLYTDRHILKAAADTILEQLNLLAEGMSRKRLLERLSWIQPEDFLDF